MQIETQIPINRTSMVMVREAAVGSLLLLPTSDGICPVIRVDIPMRNGEVLAEGLFYLASESTSFGYQAGDVRWNRPDQARPFGGGEDEVFDAHVVNLGPATVVVDYTSATPDRKTILSAGDTVYLSDAGFVLAGHDRLSNGTAPNWFYYDIGLWRRVQDRVTPLFGFGTAFVQVNFGDDFRPFRIPINGAELEA